MACKQPIILDEPVPPLYQTHLNFGEPVTEPIHIFATTPTPITLTDIQFDHISYSPPYRIAHDTIEEALRLR